MSFFGNRTSTNGGGGGSTTIIQGSKNNIVENLIDMNAISSPKEGDICYVKLTKELYMYQNSSWGFVETGDLSEVSLSKNTYSLIPTAQGQLEFDMPNIYNSTSYIDILFFNSIKVLEDNYSIVEKSAGSPSSGYKLVLKNSAPNFETAIYNLVLIGSDKN